MASPIAAISASVWLALQLGATAGCPRYRYSRIKSLLIEKSATVSEIGLYKNDFRAHAIENIKDFLLFTLPNVVFLQCG